MIHAMRLAIPPIVLALLGPGSLVQAQERAVFHGQVRDNANERAIAEVRVSLSPGGLAATTNASGRFTLDRIPYGRYEIRFERIGYVTRVDSMSVGPGPPVDITVRLAADAIPLDPIEVVARSKSLERVGFYDRLRFGPHGHVFTQADIERLAPTQLSDLLRRDPAVAILTGGPGRNTVLFNRSVSMVGGLPGCEPAVFLDGILIQDQPGGSPRLLDFNRVTPYEVEAVELYIGPITPMQYTRTSCGSILIWTKRGG
jgi:hypothetical protein